MQGLGAVRRQSLDANPCVFRVRIADDIECVCPLAGRNAVDQGSCAGALNAAQSLLPIDVKQDQPVFRTLQLGKQSIGGAKRADG